VPRIVTVPVPRTRVAGSPSSTSPDGVNPLPVTSVTVGDIVTAESVKASPLNETLTSSPGLMVGVTPIQHSPPGWLNSRKPVPSTVPRPMPIVSVPRSTSTVASCPAWAT
jgi:hypothetical protein